MCDKKNKVLFTYTDCLVLSPDFKLPNENQVLLKIPQQHNMYSFNLKNIDSYGDLACLFAKASIDESNKWLKWIKWEYSNARTPQQNGVAKRKNRTLIEVARTMLVDSFLPTTFWAEAVNTACYVLNRVLVTKPLNKTPYELSTGKQPIISYLRPFGCHVTILNTIDQLSKFDGKFDSGFLVRYSLNSKAFRVYNLETKRVEEHMHVNFLENKPNVEGKSHAWMFDLDYLTNSMNYKPVSVENQAICRSKKANNSAGTQANDDQGDKIEKTTNFKTCEKLVSQVEQIFLEEIEKLKRQEKEANDAARKETTHEKQNAHINSTNICNTVSTPLSATGPSSAFNDDELSYLDEPSMPHLKDIYTSPSEGNFTDSSYDDEGVVTDFNNLETTVNVSTTPTTRIHSIHPKTQILGDPMSVVQTRSKKVWILVYFPFGKKAIGTKWVDRNKKDERGVLVRNKARLFTQGRRQEEGIDYDEVFVLVARIEAIRIFLAFASYMGFIVYQMGVKSAFFYGIIDEEVYVSQLPGFVDPKFLNKVYKVVKALYGLHQPPKAWYATLSTFLEKSGYRRGAIDKTLFIKRDKKDIMLVQVYVDDIIFGSTKKSWSSRKKMVTLKTSHLQAMKRIFRYLKGQPKLGLWYPKVLSFDLEAYSDSDYAGASLDRKSTTGEAEYVAAAHYCRQVLWIQNQLLDYSAKRNAWNEFSCSMASVVICLAIGRKFNFSKYIFDSMEEDEVEVPNAPTPPSPTIKPSPHPQDPIPIPLQAQPDTPPSPPQEQPTTTFESFMTLLNTLMETCATLS
nr:putative ribonuclease H-like domain-containing protein [Tanacetum cinerariifolium]